MRDGDVKVTTAYVLYGAASVATRGTVTGTRLWTYRERRGIAPLIINLKSLADSQRTTRFNIQNFYMVLALR
jgi:hypothetical protein